MRGNKKQRKSSFAIFKILKACCSCSGEDGAGEEEEHWGGSPVFVTRACRSDEDVGWWVAEPGIDQRASAFIAKFYETRVSDPEFQAVPV